MNTKHSNISPPNTTARRRRRETHKRADTHLSHSNQNPEPGPGFWVNLCRAEIEMGFPVGYSELLLPKILLYPLLLLGYLRRFLLAAFRAVGLGDLLDACDEPTVLFQPQGHTQAQSRDLLHHRRPEFRPVAAMVIDEVLPVVRFEELLLTSAPAPVCGGGRCAVCLSDIGGGDEVRRLSNCRHVFHRGCLDRWMLEHEQRTCPLCRAPLIPDEMAGALWTVAAGIPDASDYDFSFFGGAAGSPLPSPTLLRPHELLLDSSHY